MSNEMILIIEDDENLASSLQDILSYKGYKAQSATCYDEVKTLFPKIELGLLDLRLPGKSC